MRKIHQLQKKCQAFQLEKPKQPAESRIFITWKVYKAQLAAIQKHIPGNWPISG
jgi:hypothetical protein